jgi:hypothetical protein
VDPHSTALCKLGREIGCPPFQLCGLPTVEDTEDGALLMKKPKTSTTDN